MINSYDAFMNIFEKGTLGLRRSELMAMVYGRVLELGSGTGVNLQYYKGSQIEHLTLSDKNISPVLSSKLDNVQFDYDIKEVDAEKIPFEDSVFDTVVVTLLFCSVPSVKNGLDEIYRVLKSDGQLLFIEHVLPEEDPLKSLLNMATPVWKHIASGCHLNREFLKSLRESNFKIDEFTKFNKTAFVSGRAYKEGKSKC